jgi:hypothetical protein
MVCIIHFHTLVHLLVLIPYIIAIAGHGTIKINTNECTGSLYGDLWVTWR